MVRSATIVLLSSLQTAAQPEFRLDRIPQALPPELHQIIFRFLCRSISPALTSTRSKTMQTQTTPQAPSTSAILSDPVPSRSILFNIDQKFDGVGGDHSAPILEVFVKVLNDLRGFYPQQGYIAKFEQDLASSGDFLRFKETYLRINGAEWNDDRAALTALLPVLAHLALPVRDVPHRLFVCLVRPSSRLR
jgi:hypothetical protein